MTHRPAAEPVVEAPKATPPPLAVAKEEPPPPVVVPDPAATAKAPEASKAPEVKGKDAKQAPPAPVATATKAAPATKGATASTPPVATATKETPAPAPVVETPKAVAPPPVVARNVISVTVPDAKPFMIRLSADVPNDADEGTALRFTVRDDVKVGESLVLAKGAIVTGQIVNGGKKRIIGSTKMTLRLIDAETNGGGKLRLRSLPGKRADGNYERPVDTGVKKSKDVAAPVGTEYVAYVDSDQTFNVRK